VRNKKADKIESQFAVRSIRVSDAPLILGAGGKTLKVLDELAIWDRPLSEDEVKMLCNGGAGLEIDKE
jgi:hypothetical protein